VSPPDILCEINELRTDKEVHRVCTEFHRVF
jgi:hypothetical protein